MPAMSVTAICVDGHKWKATQELQKGFFRGLTKWTRVVTPENCPTCSQKWNEVHAKEGQRFRPLRSGS